MNRVNIATGRSAHNFFDNCMTDKTTNVDDARALKQISRQFKNNGSDTLYANCIQQAVADTGYELGTVTEMAGRIDAIIDDEIRRCRFLIADLSDNNTGSWTAEIDDDTLTGGAADAGMNAVHDAWGGPRIASPRLRKGRISSISNDSG
jgi:hypothetical protein